MSWVLVCTGRVHMAVPVSGMTPARRERNGNKHKRLFMGGPGGLTVCFLLLPHAYPSLFRSSRLMQEGIPLSSSVCSRSFGCGHGSFTGLL